MDLSRRDFLTALLGATAATAACKRKPAIRYDGALYGQSLALGHRLRDQKLPASVAPSERIPVVVVGAGASGLSAAWRLAGAGVNDFALFELEPEPGGTSRSGQNATTAFPWAAHYVPVPGKENRALVKLLGEVGAVEGVDAQGEPVFAEEVLCRAPQERLFYKGYWYEGLYLRAGASDADLAQLRDFQKQMDAYAAMVDGKGRRAFAIPVAFSSDDAELAALDRVSMAAFMDAKGWTSPRLRWLVDYACRDDYGLSLAQTSAWAGVFYFAARINRPGDKSAELLTWPEGNGRLVHHLAKSAGARARTGRMVTALAPVEDGVLVHLVDGSGNGSAVHAEQVVVAAPKFVAARLLDSPEVRAPLAAFSYGSWVVANLALKDRPASRGYSTAWDNVLYESNALGYVVATHQSGKDLGPTVWTWYLPLVEQDPKLARQLLETSDWKKWADAAVSDLARAHLGLPELLERVDVFRWGHAMVRPTVGFMFSDARRKAAAPAGRVHFAGTDLSGVALFEEALFHGIRAAEEVLAARKVSAESWL